MNRLQTVKDALEIIKNVAEVVALIVAGMWAYSKFVETERPSLEIRGQIESSLKWFPVSDPRHCLAQFGVTMTNIGKVSFDIDAVRLRVWIVPFPVADSTVTFVDPTLFQNGEPALDREITAASLTGHYAPNVLSQFDYVFIVQKENSKVAVVRFDARTKEGGNVFSESRWEDVCGPLGARKLSRK